MDAKPEPSSVSQNPATAAGVKAPHTLSASTYEQDLLLPGNCGGSQMESALCDIRRLLASNPNDYAEGRFKELASRFNNKVARWPDLFEAERIRLGLLSRAEIEMEIGGLRSHFLLIAGPSLVSHYERVLAQIEQDRDFQRLAASNSGTASNTAAVDALRGEAMFLLTKTQEIETFRPHQERKRLSIGFETMKASAAIIAGASLLALLVSALKLLLTRPLTPLHEFGRDLVYHELPFVVVLVVAFGCLGSCMSAISRLQDSFGEGRMILNSTRYMRPVRDYLIAPISGAVFAILMALIFSAGGGQYFIPEKLKDLAPGPVADLGFRSLTLAHFTDPTQGGPRMKALALLLVWSFIAGFAERFVPDTLDRLVGGKVLAKDDEKADPKQIRTHTVPARHTAAGPSANSTGPAPAVQAKVGQRGASAAGAS